MRPIQPNEVVLFLQNPWFPANTDASLIERYTNDVTFRRQYLLTTMTGRRVHQMFGDYWYNGMWIDNANVTPSLHHRGVFPPNIEHMAKVITTQMPQLVVTMGIIARQGFKMLCSNHKSRRYFSALGHLHCPHPNTMGITNQELEAFVERVFNTMVE